ncbi:MAG: hypothetical protein GYA55_13980 [SAR324 cluster bacterium]|uniref:Uncharacterized protein n=1 Tax=SAR324 cluster bacterium TaxID=2024889 RepID=A0A7X9FTZ5_9DELT|nr:hypothetical protein [SAR324 cluster bacterium]
MLSVVGFENGIPRQEIDPDSDNAITGVLVVNPANKVCFQIKGIGPLRDHEYHRGSN